MKIKAIISAVAALAVLDASFPAQCMLSDNDISYQRAAAGSPRLDKIEDKKQSTFKTVAEFNRAARQRRMVSGSGENTSCATWRYIPKNSSDCTCGTARGKEVSCRGTNSSVGVLRCYCITHDDSEQFLVVGGCMYSCFEGHHYQSSYYVKPDPSQLNQVCEKYNRKGQLCGKCVDNFVPPIYSYNLSCVNCTRQDPNNWLKYLAVSFIPLTVFYFIIIMCRISVTSGLLNALILIAQLLTSPLLMRGLLQMHDHRSQLLLIVLASIFGIWNLDFFRLVYSSFCLHPKMTMLQVIAMDYVIAVYPLALIVVTYALVELHDYFRVFNSLWKPFRWLFGRIRRQWNVRISLIEAFATFLLLSYVKFLNVSFDILDPVTAYNVSGQSIGIYFYYNGTVSYLGRGHLPYVILAVIVLLIFNVFPIVLLCVYPCRCFQRSLARCNLRSHALHIFMDAFQGCYKNGTSGTRDYRWFSTVYLWVRIVFLIVGTITFTDISFCIGATMSIIVALMVAALQPYKSRANNIVDTALIIALAFMFISATANSIAYSINIQFKGLANTMVGISLLIPFAYLVGVVVYKLFSRRKWTQIYETIQLCLLCRCKSTDAYLEGSLPDRIEHPEQYVAMFTESAAEGNDGNESNYRTPTERTFLLGF